LEIISNEPLNILSQLVIPIFLVIITGFIQTIIKIYLSLREKNKYIKLLKDNFPSVKEFQDDVKLYKISTVYCFSYLYFIGGVAGGFLIELIFGKVITNIFDYVLDINYIGKFLTLSSNMVLLNVIALICSCFNIAIFIMIFIFILWIKYLKSKKLLIPKIDKYGIVETSSRFVYLSFWVFIGIVFGLNLAIFFYLTGILYNLSIIDNNLSFNRARFDFIYTNLLYPGFHVIAYILGFLGSLTLIVISYYCAKLFNEEVTMSLINFYKYDFPYIKIKTEVGEVKGQLRDIRNKSLVTLINKRELKIVAWDKIQIMEASNPNKNEQFIFDNDSIK